MWTIGLCTVALLVIFITQYWIFKWRNPKLKNGVILPPGSMGLPLIGETLSILFPSYSLDLHYFIKKRIQRYGPIFKTSVAGQPVIVSTDQELNNHIVLQEGRLVEFYYLDTFKDLFNLKGAAIESGLVHKYLRGTVLNHFGAEILKTKLLPRIEDFVDKTLRTWSCQPSVEVKHAASAMNLDFSAKQLFGFDAEKSAFGLTENYSGMTESLMTFPLNIPGTAYNKCLKSKEKLTSMLREIITEKRNSAVKSEGDMLDQMISDMNKQGFLSDDFILSMMFGLLVATGDTISTIVALALNLLSENPSALQELTTEHDAILKKRENPNSALTWEEYKSMTFTHQVINELLRVGNLLPGLLRRALKDIPIKGTGFTIPEGWTIMLVTSSLQFDPNTYKDPLGFNPWRWKELEQHVVAKTFKPFGGGSRQCAGAEYTRVFLATFFHVLLTKYRWTKIKAGQIVRNPVLGFGKGIHIKFSQQIN